MFQKVITIDDLDSINIAIVQALRELRIPRIEHVPYCDEAFLEIKKAQFDGEPFDLLISDLSFKNRYGNEKTLSGEALIHAVKKIQPQLKVLVFSIEDQHQRIKKLVESEEINGYVLKGRNSIPELKKAITSIYSNTLVYLSSAIAHQIADKFLLEIENFDIELLKSLSKGFNLDEIEFHFKNKETTPCGSNSIEKRIKQLQILFKANNTVHLIAITKDLGLI